MKVLTGHLTQTNKIHIKALFKANMLSGKVNRINYFLSLNENVYTVTIIQNLTTTIGDVCKPTTFKATFTL